MIKSSPLKRIVLLLVVLLLASSTGCNSGKEAKSSPASLAPTETVTDSIGRVVEVPANVNRIACLYAFAGHVVTMLGKGDDIVAEVQGLKRDILLNQLVPAIGSASVPYNSDKINIEELTNSQPDLIFLQLVTYQDQKEREKLDKLKVPYFVVDFNSIDSQINTIENMGKAIGKGEEALKYTTFFRNSLQRVFSVVAKIPQEQRVKIFHSILEATRTDPDNSLPADWTKVAGLVDVSVGQQLRADGERYYASLEQVYLWDPDAIIVNEDDAYTYITTNSQWASLRAVKNQKVYKLPNGISRWGHEGSLETPMALLWAAKTFYPDYFPDLDLKQETRDFYQTYFNVSLDDNQVAQILAGMGMRLQKGN